MAISDVSICNNALTLLGAATITSLTESSENARKCNVIYEQTRDGLLRVHPWRFAINRASLAIDATPPAYDYNNRFVLPTTPKCLRVLEMYENRDDGDYKWDIEGRYVVSDASTCRIKYVGQITDPTTFDTMFIEAFSASLAAKLSLPITNSLQIQGQMAQLAAGAIQQAYFLDAIEGDPEDQPVEDEGSWLNTR
jgi:hypothetical protein